MKRWLICVVVCMVLTMMAGAVEMTQLATKTAVAVLCGLGVLFTVFTFFTPEIGLFRDPLTGGYGI